MTRQESYQTIMYLAGLEALKKLAVRLDWDVRQYEAARVELVKIFEPAPAVI